MAYNPQTWQNEAPGGTPLSAARFAHMEAGIEDADNRLTAVEAALGDKVSASALDDAVADAARRALLFGG